MTHTTNAPLRHWARKIVYGIGILALIVAAGALVMFMPKPGYDLPIGKRAAPLSTIIYATGTTLHFGTETQPMAHSPSSMASTAGGLYYIAQGTLYRWKASGGSQQVADVGKTTLSTSADGRWLAYLDFKHGPKNMMGERVVETVVFDTTTGDRIIRDRTGQGDFKDDLADLYEDAEPRILGFDKHSVFVTAAEGDTFGYNLSTGNRTTIDAGVDINTDPSITNNPGGATGLVALKGGRAKFLLHDGAGSQYNAWRSPNSRHVVYNVDDAILVFAPDKTGTGKPVHLPTPLRDFIIYAWADNVTFYGVATVAEHPGKSTRLVSCDIVARACKPFSEPLSSETEDAGIVLANTDNAY